MQWWKALVESKLQSNQRRRLHVRKKGKILVKIVMGKEAKGFDLIECRTKDTMIGEEYAKLFPFGFVLVKDINLPIDRFKRSPSKIVYHLLFKKHVNKIKMRIIVYNKFDAKVAIFTILEDQKRPNYILPCRLRKWEDNHNL